MNIFCVRAGYAAGATIALAVAAVSLQPGEADEVSATRVVPAPTVTGSVETGATAPRTSCTSAAWPYVPVDCLEADVAAMPARIVRPSRSGDGRVAVERSPLSGF